MSPQSHAFSAGISSKGQELPEWSGGLEPEPTARMWVPLALEELSYTLNSKNADYRVTSSEFSNFHFAGDVAGLPARDVMLAQIGIKLGRLKGLLDRKSDPNWESIEDTIKDLAGYAVILYAYQLSLEVAK